MAQDRSPDLDLMKGKGEEGRRRKKKKGEEFGKKREAMDLGVRRRSVHIGEVDKVGKYFAATMVGCLFRTTPPSATAAAAAGARFPLQ